MRKYIMFVAFLVMGAILYVCINQFHVQGVRMDEKVTEPSVASEEQVTELSVVSGEENVGEDALSDDEEDKKVIRNMSEMYNTIIPKYVTVNGQELDLYSVGNGGYQVCIQNTTSRECREYVALLEKEGFRKYSEVEIPAGKGREQNPNLFYVFTTEDIHVFLSWNTSLGTSRIVFGYPEELPSLEAVPLEEGDNMVPSVTQMQIETGMSYVIQLPDASFIVIDGGVYGYSDSKRLYDFMVEHSPENQRPIVTMWMYTHPDPDHIQLATEFISRYADEIEIKAFAYNFPDCEIMETKQDDLTIQLSINVLEKYIKEYYPESVTYTLHTGQTYYFKGVKIEILLTEEDVYPIIPTVYNDTTAVWRMSFDNGESFMVLGDCTHQLSKQLAATYGDYLKSDILQLAHHGLIGGDKELYQLIDPAVCFWATFEERFNGNYSKDKHQWCLGEGGCDYNAWIRDESVRIREHYHNSITTTVMMGGREREENQ